MSSLYSTLLRKPIPQTLYSVAQTCDSFCSSESTLGGHSSAISLSLPPSDPLFGDDCEWISASVDSSSSPATNATLQNLDELLSKPTTPRQTHSSFPIQRSGAQSTTPHAEKIVKPADDLNPPNSVFAWAPGLTRIDSRSSIASAIAFAPTATTAHQRRVSSDDAGRPELSRTRRDSTTSLVFEPPKRHRRVVDPADDFQFTSGHLCTRNSVDSATSLVFAPSLGRKPQRAVDMDVEPVESMQNVVYRLQVATAEVPVAYPDSDESGFGRPRTNGSSNKLARTLGTGPSDSTDPRGKPSAVQRERRFAKRRRRLSISSLLPSWPMSPAPSTMLNSADRSRAGCAFLAFFGPRKDISTITNQPRQRTSQLPLNTDAVSLADNSFHSPPIHRQRSIASFVSSASLSDDEHRDASLAPTLPELWHPEDEAGFFLFVSKFPALFSSSIAVRIRDIDTEPRLD